MNVLNALILVLSAAAIYSIPVVATYSEKVRQSYYIWILGICCPAVADIIWIYVAKKINDNSQIFLYSISWEIFYKIVVISVPVLFFGLKLTPLSYFGVFLMLLGGIFIKIGSGI